ncbi:ATP-binding protein [Paenibacillus sp. sgz500958]|uniref:sensor histidine kinase n=1 Tax=Paenibacillus sp. sgz500958 TaxID=3242475 RepID=UPI0036D3B1AE
MGRNANTPISLFQWIWRTYIKSTVVPLVLVELVFIGIYFVTNEWSRERQTLIMKNEVLNEMQVVASQEAALIENQTHRISLVTNLYRDSISDVLRLGMKLSEEDAGRLTMNSDGVYYSKADSASGGAAVFYSGIQKVGEQEKKKVASLLVLQPFMKGIIDREPLAAAVYYNSSDSLNIIYPYFDVISQYAPKMDIPTFNFYYEADMTHNPTREATWTDAYLDPAGNGWLASSIAPVYKGDVLQGVVGIDVTVETFKDQVLEMDIPWDGLGMLISNNGSILAMPEQAEQLFGIEELTSHNYQETVQQDTFKPDEFNLYYHKDLKSLYPQITANKSGLSEVTIGDKKQILAWASVENTGWKLMVLASEDKIFAGPNHLKHELTEIGILMILGLIFFYVIYFTILYRRAKVMSERISQPLMDINMIAVEIGNGNYEQQTPDIHVNEIRDTAHILVGVGKDLGVTNSALTEARDALESREADMNAMIQSIDDIIAEIDEYGNIEKVWTVDKKFNLDLARKLEGIRIDDLLAPEDAKRFIDILSEVLNTGQTMELEYSLETSKGPRWMLVNLTLIRKRNDSVRRVCMVSRDITDRKQAEESMRSSKEIAEKASKAKTEFLSNMSHELRTPMNAILGFAQLLQYDTSEPLSESQQENVQEIIKAGKHLLELISEILDLSRIESGRLALTMESVRFGDVLEECFAWVQPISVLSGIHLYNNAQPSYEQSIRCDRMRIKQVILNLLSNAIKYNKPDGSVTVSAYTVDEHQLAIVIKDTGIGIRSEDLLKIFEPFQRLLEGKQVEGTGIGLTVSHKLLEMMEGKIEVTSTVGEGSIFKLLIPLG